MNQLLTHTDDEYRREMKYFKQVATIAIDSPEREMVALAIEALRYAAIRQENPPLTYQHLKEMHGQPVYCSSIYGGACGGGIVNAKKDQVILLDHDGVWRDTLDWGYGSVYYRFPLNGVDLLAVSQTG